MDEHLREKNVVDIHVIHQEIIAYIFMMIFFSLIIFSVYLIFVVAARFFYPNINFSWWIFVFSVLQLSMIFMAVFLFLEWANVYYIILPTIFIIRSGIINTQETSRNIFFITNIQVEQGFWGKIFNYGDILLNKGTPRQVILNNIPNPYHWAHILQEHRSRLGMGPPE